MSRKFLGDQLDIHGGGQDVVFPHHENEIAQSEAFTGIKPFVIYWLHNGLLRMGEEKMSKSLGNLITIRDALKKYTADAIRIFILSSYYRSPLTYTEEALSAAQAGADRLFRVASKADTTVGKGQVLDAKPYYDRFLQAMDDDFNTPQAIAALFDLARDINSAEGAGMAAGQARRTLKELGAVLGLTFKGGEEEPLDAGQLKELFLYFSERTKGIKGFVLGKMTSPNDAESNISLLIDIRKELRKAKQFKLSDDIRNKLLEMGIVLEDTPSGTVWKKKR
jgi:cysteinyl-tRNA synthetase